MEHLHRAYEMLDRELENIVTSGQDMTNTTLDQIDELTHAMKSLKTIIAMHEADNGASGRVYYDDGYDRGRGMYVRDGMPYGRGDRSYRGGRMR